MTCARVGSVEAHRDGRLSSEQAGAMAVHLAECPACAAEMKRLAGVTAALSTLTEAEADANRVLAGRRRLLAAAERDGDRRRSAHSAVVVVTAVAAALAIGVFGAGMWRGKARGTSSAAPVAGAGFEVSVTPLGAARWSRASSVARETLTLDDGGLRVAVTRHDAGHRVLVELPDGELEDVGTVFSVRVSAGTTREVDVMEGVVALRLRGSSERRLAAGESYRASEPERGAASDATATSARGVGEQAESAASAEQVVLGRAPRTGTHEGQPPDSCAEASLFQDGVEAFRHGDYMSAANTLARFSGACAHSGHAEDAAYLRMVALARAGHTDEARTQALAYLKRFPTGFRRKEAERLAGAE